MRISKRAVASRDYYARYVSAKLAYCDKVPLLTVLPPTGLYEHETWVITAL
jgi:hypothetical protein